MNPGPASAADPAAPVGPEPALRPVAIVQGSPLVELPRDLYIPPDALEVFLETFEGPLDLLLYLIRRQNLDILNIPIVEITRQYMEYVELMKGMRLELAAEYLVMAAMLAEIKSRMLLPRPVLGGEDEEADPRAELVRRLQEYERFQQAAVQLDQRPQLGRDFYQARARYDAAAVPAPLPTATLAELLRAFKDLLARAQMFSHHHVQREALSVRERMAAILQRLEGIGFAELSSLCGVEEGRLGVVVTFLAVLELVRESLIELVQSELFAPIHVRLAGR